MRRFGRLALLCLAACGGAAPKTATTPDKAKSSDPQSMNDFGDPADKTNPNDNNPRPPGSDTSASGSGTRSGGPGGASGMPGGTGANAVTCASHSSAT